MKRRILYIILIFLIAVGGYCGYRYYLDAIQPEKLIAAEDDRQNSIFRQVKPDITVYELASEKKDNVPEAEAPQLLAPAEEVNESTNAWLTIPGTHIDYPVVQGNDNDFYLHHGFDGQLNQELGCPFLDFRCSGDYSGFNSIVYAHHMTKQRMFADIALYKDESFLDGHSVGYLITDDAVHTVDFFAYLSVPSTAPAYHAVFVMDSEKREYIDYLFETAKYSKEINIDENSHLLLLSTCTFEYEEARGILVGVIE